MRMSLKPKKKGKPRRTPRPVDMAKTKDQLERDLARVKRTKKPLKIRARNIEWIVGSYVKWAKEDYRFGRYTGELTDKGKVLEPEEIGHIKPTPLIYGKSGIPSPSQIVPMKEEEEWRAQVEMKGAIRRLMRAAWRHETIEQLEKQLEEIDVEWVRMMEDYILAGKNEEAKKIMAGLKLFREDVEAGRRSGYVFWFTKTPEDIAAEKEAKETFIEKELVGPKRHIDEDRPHITHAESWVLRQIRSRKKKW